jgi:hypothetical protein
MPNIDTRQTITTLSSMIRNFSVTDWLKVIASTLVVSGLGVFFGFNWTRDNQGHVTIDNNTIFGITSVGIVMGVIGLCGGLAWAGSRHQPAATSPTWPSPSTQASARLMSSPKSDQTATTPQTPTAQPAGREHHIASRLAAILPGRTSHANPTNGTVIEMPAV